MSLELVLITGMSGSGKSVALHALEDLGFYCVDNLPPELLIDFINLEIQLKTRKVAIAMDVRSKEALPQVPAQLEALRQRGIQVRLLFLESTTDTLVHRYSETRRRHPLSAVKEDAEGVPAQMSAGQLNLSESIEIERGLLADLRELSHIIDTSLLRSAKLQSYIHALIGAPAAALTLMFESFAFKRGIPVHADYVFDVRMLPNPHYEPALSKLTGMDAPVAKWLEQQADVQKMQSQIAQFINNWLPALDQDHRSYVTIAIGCTGGQHRSVFLVEALAKEFKPHWVTLKRHRELGQ